MCIRDSQEAADYVQIAFDVADYYRNPVMVLADGMIGQMMEAIEWHDVPKRELPAKTWATTGTHGQRQPNVINSLYIDPNLCATHNERLAAKYRAMEENETRWEEVNIEGCEIPVSYTHLDVYKRQDVTNINPVHHVIQGVHQLSGDGRQGQPQQQLPHTSLAQILIFPLVHCNPLL